MASRGEVGAVRSRQLHTALTQLAEEAAVRLQAHVASGEEVPFELDSRSSGRGTSPLYCYRPLTAAYVAERFPALRALASYRLASAQLEAFDGLDRYLLAVVGVDRRRRGAYGRADTAALAFLQDVFDEQTDFQLRAERLARALARLDGAALAKPSEVTIVAPIHGLAIASEELPLASGLRIARLGALDGAPQQALGLADLTDECLLVVYTAEDAGGDLDGETGTAAIADLLRALRLYGDGRIAVGPLAWRRLADGPWSALALGGKGHPHGTLLVAADHEDELRAFCNLVSRRAPAGDALEWALRRFEMGCQRSSEYDALTDHLLALRALLAGGSSELEDHPDDLLAGRLAALCATPEDRGAAADRALAAIELEREAIAGTAVEHAAGLALARELAGHLRALLRDVICGHLPSDLASLADELLEARPLGEEALGDGGEAGEVLNIAV